MITDYISVGGAGAMLINSAVAGLFAVCVLAASGCAPTGQAVMALWVTVGFACFGKNMFNMFPLFCGVAICSKIRNAPFKEYVIPSLLSSTLSPVVSEVGFWNTLGTSGTIMGGIALGVFCGLMFPVISACCERVHGVILYNMGFAGGIIAFFPAAFAKSVGVEFEQTLLWDTGHTPQMAFLMI